MDNPDFEAQWQEIVLSRVSRPDEVAPEVKTLLWAMYSAASAESLDVKRLILALDQLLVFLASPNGRTNANCWAADIFVALSDGWNWQLMPEELADTFGDMSSLHDTVSNPEIAANFGGLPEQILAKLRGMQLP
jgi:hypothetical protein